MAAPGHAARVEVVGIVVNACSGIQETAPQQIRKKERDKGPPVVRAPSDIDTHAADLVSLHSVRPAGLTARQCGAASAGTPDQYVAMESERLDLVSGAIG